MKPPNLFLIGAPKCATTSLYTLLSRHRDIYCPTIKEPGYYTRHMVRAPVKRAAPHMKSWAGYLGLFNAGQDARYRCDGSTSYLRDAQALNQIAQVPNAKVIAVYRDPVQLVRSYHGFLLNEAWEDQPDLQAAWDMQDMRASAQNAPKSARRIDAVQYAQVAMMGQQLQTAQALFGDHLRIYEMRDLVHHTDNVSRDIQAWLGLTVQDLGNLPRNNLARAPKSQVLNRFIKAPPAPLAYMKSLIKRALGQPSLGVTRMIGRLNEAPAQHPLSDPFKARLQAFFEADVKQLELCVGRNLRSEWGWL